MPNLDQNKRYYAEDPSTGGHTPVYVQRKDGARKELSKRRDLHDHADGFGWGTSGPSGKQLSLAILAECCDDQTAVEYHEQFHRRFVADYAASQPIYVTCADIRPMFK